MKAGQLDRTITIKHRSETLNAFREPVEAWAPIATLRARVLSGSADELATGAGQEAATTLTFEARFVDGITVADRLTYAGVDYDIRGVAEIGRRRGLTIRAVARPGL